MGEERLVVSVNKASYAAGDSVMIFGTATVDAPVALQVTNPKGKTILSITVKAGSDGAFMGTFNLQTDSLEGIYNVTASVSGVTKMASLIVGPPAH